MKICLNNCNTNAGRRQARLATDEEWESAFAETEGTDNWRDDFDSALADVETQCPAMAREAEDLKEANFWTGVFPLPDDNAEGVAVEQARRLQARAAFQKDQ